jgi:uncharacterized protein (TIGR02271 family)
VASFPMRGYIPSHIGKERNHPRKRRFLRTGGREETHYIMENRKHHDIRAEGQHELNRLFGFDVLDNDRESIGSIDNIWVDQSGQPEFFGVQTGWLFGKIHVVPAQQAAVNYENRRVRVPYSKEKVKDAPSFDTSADLSPEQENEVYRYYGLARAHGDMGTTHPREGAGRTREPTRHTEGEHNIQLNEERAEVRKQQKDIGGVRLRKIIRTETVDKPVELTHEDVEIERVPAGKGQTAPSNLEEDEIYIPLRQEEAVVHKETHPKEQVRVNKKTERERKDVSETVRKEDLEIERDDDDRRKYGT